MGNALPDAEIPVNEQFTSGAMPNYSNTNWGEPGPVGSDKWPALDFADHMYFSSPTPDLLIPPPMPPVGAAPWGQVAVDHWTGGIQIGSLTAGAGAPVQTHTWQDWQDHGSHCNRMTPVDNSAGTVDFCP